MTLTDKEKIQEVIRLLDELEKNFEDLKNDTSFLHMLWKSDTIKKRTFEK
jgi:hypothetical protein